ncbi:MAG: type I-E CRISPR-associated endoribonuclease Cas2 [Bryobacteraceae bacterium]|nr:type I-E CRISPR-associated endoribonuclease Cas2 [Bryobacteraceae bacterium]
MVVLILERVPVSLRGELTRWLLEARAGVFVGSVSAGVRDKLWEKTCSAMAGGGGILIHNADNEQGFAVRFWGATNRWVVDYEGLTLIRTPESP